jgi:hypothetical protein
MAVHTATLLIALGWGVMAETKSEITRRREDRQSGEFARLDGCRFLWGDVVPSLPALQALAEKYRNTR